MLRFFSLIVDINAERGFEIPFQFFIFSSLPGGVLGRSSSCDVYLDDVNISKEHARLVFNEEENSFTVQDLGSRNGTFLNTVRTAIPQLVTSNLVFFPDDNISLKIVFYSVKPSRMKSNQYLPVKLRKT